MSNALDQRKYAKISFEAVREHLVSIMKAKGGNLADASESSYGRLMTDLFSGTADLMGYYAESGFMNAFMEPSSTSTPSIYANARMLGYSIRRPVPAKAGIGIAATKTGKYNSIRVRIPKGTEFTIGGLTLTAMDDMEFYYNRNTDPSNTGLMTLVSGKAVVAEGQFKTETLVSTGKQNQIHVVNDTTFSDYFGDNDPNFDDDGNVAHRAAAFTTVTSDATLMDNVDPSVVVNDKLYWRVSRRGLIDPAKENVLNDIEKFVAGQDNYTDNYTVEITTANDGNVQLKFGDGLNSAIPYGLINVTYFSTLGEGGNLLDVAGTVLATSDSKIVITQGDGTESDITLEDLNIALTTDIRSGLDIQSIESIKADAPYIFNSLDKLVNRMSYKIFLRRYADVKYATAFGEDILNTKLQNGSIDVKFMNQIRFSVLKSLYRKKDKNYYPTTSNEYFLDGCKINGLMYTWLYDYGELSKQGLDSGHWAMAERVNKAIDSVFDGVVCYKNSEGYVDVSEKVKQAIRKAVMPSDIPMDYQVYSAKLSPLDFVETGSELYNVMTSLNQRGMVTLGGGYHNYVYPSVHEMQCHLDITLYRGNNFTDVKERVQNIIYKYLSDNTEFASPIYRSRIEALVHNLTEVEGVDVTFAPVVNQYNALDVAQLPWLGSVTSEFIAPGSVTIDPFDFTLQYTLVESNVKTTTTRTFTMPNQSTIQNLIADYCSTMISNHLETVTDLEIDRFVAYIWSQVMQQIYTPIADQIDTATAQGDIETVRSLRALIDAIKGWELGPDSLTFKDTDTITSMSEVNGNTLYDYLKYGLNYIKLIRNVLAYYVTKSLIDENGNITNYTNDNEIVQVVVPVDEIDLTVSLDSVLLTE
jgi:hypothetical protein